MAIAPKFETKNFPKLASYTYFLAMSVAHPLLSRFSRSWKGGLLAMKDTILWLVWIPASLILLVLMINTFIVT